MEDLTNDSAVVGERIIGLDLLRILSMLMVILLHILGQGGILDGTVSGSRHYYLAWAMECVCYCAVDCYGLLSGYVSAARRRYRHSKIVLLWLEVVFYSVAYACVFRLISHEYAGKRELLNALFPVMRRQYWYFTAFFALSLLAPVIHGGMRSITARTARLAAALLFLVFCVLPAIFCTDPFHLRGGYSALWLIVLYALGLLLNKGGILKRIAPGWLAAAFFLCTALTFLLTVVFPVSIPRLGTISPLNYTSPTVLLSAVSLLFLLRRLEVRASRLRRLLSRLSGASFGVYILHTNPLVWTFWFRPGVLKGFADAPVWAFPLLAVGAAAAVYLLCFAVDSVRAWVFQKLRLRIRLEKWEESVLRKLGPAENSEKAE